jgi:hypothetical protein
MAYNASVAPFSVAQLRVLRWLAGGAAERIWIRDPGAVWANGGRPVLGAAVYSSGEEVIVFGVFESGVDSVVGVIVAEDKDTQPQPPPRGPGDIMIKAFPNQALMLTSGTRANISSWVSARF